MAEPRRKGRVARELVGREVVDMATAALLPNPRNPQKHGEEQIVRLMASLRSDGQTKPVLARRENSMLIAGHGVHEAAARLGMDTLSVVLLDVDQPTADRIMLGDNRQGQLSTTDQDRVAELLREIEEVDWMATGFSPEEVEKAFAKVEAGDLVVHELEVSDRRDTFWISVRGPLGDQAQALKRIKAMMRDMAEVEVTLGTTDDLS